LTVCVVVCCVGLESCEWGEVGSPRIFYFESPVDAEEHKG
jgi:hypothetical protein